MNKEALEINLPIPALLGSATGALIGSSHMKKTMNDQQAKEQNKNLIGDNYYSQVENIARNMDVLFTPYSVIFVLKNMRDTVTIDTIDTSSMNMDMKIAWQERDKNYFKNLLLNKIRSEIQFAEQQFAKNIINKHMSLGKMAGYELTSPEVYGFSDNMHDFYEKNENEKVASVMLSEFLDMDDVMIKVALDIRNKSEGDSFSENIGNKLSFLGLGNNGLDSIQKSVLSPGAIKKFGQVGFLPDRVMFIMNGVVLTQLSVFDMDAETFDRFEKKDKAYFLDVFNREAKIGLTRMKAKFPQKKNLTKEAGFFSDITDIFYNNYVHPYIYYKVLIDKYTKEWFDFEPTALIKMLESDFELTEPIGDIPLNKILSVQAVNAAEAVFSNPHAFEKVIRSFASLPINFLESESDDISMSDYAFGITAFDIVTPENDTYDDFSDEVYTYIVKLLAKKNIKLFYPLINLSQSPSFSEFYGHLNESLVNENNKLDVDEVTSLAEKAKIILNNELINEIGSECLLAAYGEGDINSVINSYAKKVDIADITAVIKNNVRDNLDIQAFLVTQKDILEGQMGLYELESR